MCCYVILSIGKYPNRAPSTWRKEGLSQPLNWSDTDFLSISSTVRGEDSSVECVYLLKRPLTGMKIENNWRFGDSVTFKQLKIVKENSIDICMFTASLKELWYNGWSTRSEYPSTIVIPLLPTSCPPVTGATHPDISPSTIANNSVWFSKILLQRVRSLARRSVGCLASPSYHNTQYLNLHKLLFLLLEL